LKLFPVEVFWIEVGANCVDPEAQLLMPTEKRALCIAGYIGLRHFLLEKKPGRYVGVVVAFL
jgi:hypothetical protein